MVKSIGGIMNELIVRFDANPEFGQMVPEERKALFDVAIENRCKRILEIGTWRGVGSTYILASAAKSNDGVLYTVESDKRNYDTAQDIYNTELSYLKPSVIFVYGDSSKEIPGLIKAINFDMVFFDGEENGEKTFKDFRLIEKKIEQGCVIACHDWNIGKQSKLRPYLESSKDFEQAVIISDSPTGFAVYKKT